MGFSPDGCHFVAQAEDGVLQVWDLRLIRRQLAERKLDWDLPPYPAAKGPADPSPAPLKVTMDLRGMAAAPPPQVDAERLRVRHLLHTLQIAGYPWHPEPHHLRGHIHEQLGEPQKAVDDFSAALFWQPHVPAKVSHLLHARAANHLRSEQAGLAVADLRRAVEVNPNDLVARNSLAWFYVTGPDAFRDAGQALPHAQLAFQRAPQNGAFANTLGVVQYRLGKWREAVATLEKSIALAKNRQDAHNLFVLAMCHARLQNTAKAQECFDLAVQWCEQQNNLPAHHNEELMAFRAEAEDLLQGK
jgi:tetratricopeptide (TPR) repeat protein